MTDHHRLLREAFDEHRGVEVKTEGDAFFVVFRSAAEGVAAAVGAQRRLAGHAWPHDVAVPVRMGLHTGEVALVGGEYVGLDVHRAARIAAAAHGGQVVVSQAVADLLEGVYPDGVTLRDLGEHRLRDLERSEHLHQLVIEGLRSEFPPLATVGARVDIVPAQLTTFVGRERELAEVERLLEGTRLLTLTGPGGTGKTRLALALASRVRERFPDGIAFVELAAISDPALVASTIRQTLRYSEEAGRTAIEVLAVRLAATGGCCWCSTTSSRCCGAAPVVAELLSGRHELTFVVTSRAVLRLHGEQEYAVPPLGLPEQPTPPIRRGSPSTEAVALFVQRARPVRPGFAVTAQNASAIAEICRRLDGLPLAIELAASRIKLLPPDALLARLQDRLDVLRSAPRPTGPIGSGRCAGRSTGAMGCSTRTSRPCSDACSIFRGGATIASADAVVRAAGPAADVLDGLAVLVDQSLVRQLEESGEPRFGMLETIREFGREQLEATGELTATADAHASYFAALVAEAEPFLTSDTGWLDRLETEHDDLRSAFGWLADHGRIDEALTMGFRMWRFLHLRGHLREGSARLRSLLERPDAAASTTPRARALVGLAGLVYWMNDYAAASDAYMEALPVARAEGERALEAEILYSLGYVRDIRQDWDGSAGRVRRSTPHLRSHRLGDGRRLRADGGGHDRDAPWRARAGRRHPRRCDRAIRAARSIGSAAGTPRASATEPSSCWAGWTRPETGRSRRSQPRHAIRTRPACSSAILDLAAIEAIAGDPERGARLVGVGQHHVRASRRAGASRARQQTRSAPAPPRTLASRRARCPRRGRRGHARRRGCRVRPGVGIRQPSGSPQSVNHRHVPSAGAMWTVRCSTRPG